MILPPSTEPPSTTPPLMNIQSISFGIRLYKGNSHSSWVRHAWVKPSEIQILSSWTGRMAYPSAGQTFWHMPRQCSSIRKGGWYGWEPSSSSNLSIRVFRAYPLSELSQTVPRRAIRGSSISVSSTLPPLKTCLGVNYVKLLCGRQSRLICHEPFSGVKYTTTTTTTAATTTTNNSNNDNDNNENNSLRIDMCQAFVPPRQSPFSDPPLITIIIIIIIIIITIIIIIIIATLLYNYYYYYYSYFSDPPLGDGEKLSARSLVPPVHVSRLVAWMISNPNTYILILHPNPTS